MQCATWEFHNEVHCFVNCKLGQTEAKSDPSIICDRCLGKSSEKEDSVPSCFIISSSKTSKVDIWYYSVKFHFFFNIHIYFCSLQQLWKWLPSFNLCWEEKYFLVTGTIYCVIKNSEFSTCLLCSRFYRPDMMSSLSFISGILYI